jgi:hypothetical protein
LPFIQVYIETLPSIRELEVQEILEASRELAAFSEPPEVEEWLLELLVQAVVLLDRTPDKRKQ